jgi:hypothetical protein
MANFEKIFELRDESFIVKVPYIKVYIPESYVMHDIAEVIGQDIDTIGLFYFDVFGEDPSKYEIEDPYKNPVRYFYKLPTYIRMCPSRIIVDERDEEKNLVNVLEFAQGDKFIHSINLAKDWKVVNKFVELLIKGFIPKAVRYDEIAALLRECCNINDVDLNIADTIAELLISELSRDPLDIKKPFRYAIKDNPSIDMRSKKSIKIDILGRLNNTFAAISSADPKQGITVSITRERNNEENIISPVEEAIKSV